MARRAMTGPRLPYVVRKLEGTIPVTTMKFDRRSGKCERYEAREDAGYIAFFPQGHWLRIRTKADLERYGISKRPRPIGDDGLAIDPRYSPKDAFEQLEAKVIDHVKKVCGPIKLDGFDGKLNLPKLELEDNYVS